MEQKQERVIRNKLIFECTDQSCQYTNVDNFNCNSAANLSFVIAEDTAEHRFLRDASKDWSISEILIYPDYPVGTKVLISVTAFKYLEFPEGYTE